jgi:hypothetical protein
MTINKLALAAAACVLVTGLGASAAIAAGAAACQTWNPSKVSPPVTHCLTWKQEAAARMRAANCDPAVVADAAMRAECTAMMSNHRGEGARPSAAG